MKTGLRTIHNLEGVLFQVRRPNGQVAWQKFVKWGLFKCDRAGYAQRAWQQAQKAMLER